MDIFHRGYNVFNEISDNVLVYTMDRPEMGGLELEVAGYFGDSGSGGFVVDDDGQMRIAGVLSHGTGAYWGSVHGYTRVGGYHWEWIKDNMNSVDERVPQQSQKCTLEDIYDGCEDTNLGPGGIILGDSGQDTCLDYASNRHWCGKYDDDVFNSMVMCCACGGGAREGWINCGYLCDCELTDRSCWKTCHGCLLDHLDLLEGDAEAEEEEGEQEEEQEEEE